MEVKSLFLIGNESFRIEIYPKEDKYYISDETALIKTTKEKFIKKLEKCKDVCINSWDKTLANKYWDLYLWAVIEG